MIDEGMRHRLHGRFEELLGADEATAVMTALRFEGLATSEDLRRLGDRLDGRIDTLEARFEARLDERLEATADRIIAEIRRETISRSMFFAVMGLMIAYTTLVATLLRI